MALETNQSIDVWPVEYGVTDGRLLVGRATNSMFDMSPVELRRSVDLVCDFENDLYQSVAYEIDNDRKKIDGPQGEDSIIWTWGIEQIIVPNVVIVFDVLHIFVHADLGH